MEPEYLEVSEIPRVPPQTHVFNRYGKPSDFTRDLFTLVVKLAIRLYDDEKLVRFQGESGRIHQAQQYQMHTLYDSELTYASLLQTTDAKNNRFLQKFVKIMTNNNVKSRAAHVLFLVLNDILNYNKELYYDDLKVKDSKIVSKDAIERIAERIYSPSSEQRKIDDKEGLRLISLYKVLAASNKGDREKTKIFFKEHAKNFPSDDKEILTDFITLLNQYKKNKISAQDLIGANPNPTLTDLMLYCFYAYMVQDMDFLEAVMLNPKESHFLHELILMLFYFIDQSDKDYFRNYKFLIVSIHMAVQENIAKNNQPNSGYSPEVIRILNKMAQSIQNKAI